MAGRGWKKFTREILSSADVQDYLMDQSVMRFDSNADRAAELLEPSPGMVAHMADYGLTQVYGGGSGPPGWHTLTRFLGYRNTYPTGTVERGDHFYSIPHQCHMIANGFGWAQVETPSVNGRAALDSLYNAVVAAGMVMPDGFRVFAYGIDRLYLWDRATWALVSGKTGAKVAVSPAAGFDNALVPNRFHVRQLGNGMAHLDAVFRKSGTPSVTFDATGRPNSADDLMYVGTLPAWYETLDRSPILGRGTGRTFFGYVEGGTLVVSSVHGDLAAIPVNGLVHLSGTYRLYHAAGMPV